ncbi:probable LRR receptor-like serine/threonine-protein kinase At3g47570 [Camellia sinensis]|uniref:probable LRR receptor-like serine/threonine-protein kinase At3g47570 n=1 Tax=Camellia sinensis TaxID=4442 RepID=UPI001036B9E0|nr:probable LRR receptor-like serine/threonine-protein kinase At3g47570 [Camellia sinensis]
MVIFSKFRMEEFSQTLVPSQLLEIVNYAEELNYSVLYRNRRSRQQGGHGSIYKGILNSGEQIIAVKVFKLHERRANKSFVTECEALKNIRHRNLVKIITTCSSIDFKGNNFKALVFEFMEKGCLENWLHPSLLEQHEPKNLNFVQRLNIAIDVACALDYLHHHCEMAFIHCDLKPSNILLDGDLPAHISDFGLAKIFSATNGISMHQQSSSIGIR